VLSTNDHGQVADLELDSFLDILLGMERTKGIANFELAFCQLI